MKYLRIGVIGVLLFIIAVLSAYIIIANNNSLLKIPVNYYLKRYNINAHFKKIRINSPESVELNGFSIKKSNLEFSCDKLVLSINHTGQISLVLKNPIVIIKQASRESKDKFRFPFKIAKLNIDNMTLQIFRNKQKTVDAKNVDMKINKNVLEASGIINYSHKNTNVEAHIISMKGVFKLSNSSVLFEKMSINPQIIRAKIAGVDFKTTKKIEINGLFISFSPFSVKLNRAFTNMSLKFMGQNLEADLFINLKYKKFLALSLSANNIKSAENSLSVDFLKLTATNKKKLKISLEYKNLSINRKNIIAQNLSGKMNYAKNLAVGSISSGEAVIFGRWYADFSKNGLNFKFLNKPNRKLFLNLAKLFKLKLKARSKNLVEFNLKSVDLRNFFKAAVKDAFESGFFKKITLGKGRFDIDGIYDMKKNKFMARLDFLCDNIGFKNGIKLKSVSLSLPVFYNYEGGGKGFVKRDNITVKYFNISLKSRVYAENNKLYFENFLSNSNGLSIKPFGVLLNIKSKIIKTKLQFGFKKKKEAVFGNLKSIVLKNNAVKTVGDIRLNIFGGRIDIFNISLKNLFSLPVLNADINFQHINLKKLTQKTNFGLVSGYVKGCIHNLSLVNFKNPLSFYILVRTQNVRGVSKRITLKAINSLSKIGGGYVKIAIPFFKSFPYSTIGFYATLKNNRFSIHGLYKNKESEYIIKKGFLFGVNVVNMNKDSSISWDDMLERIKRVLKGNDVEIK